jgi:hypothetical protein
MSTREIAEQIVAKIKSDSKHAPVSDEAITDRIDRALQQAIAQALGNARASCVACGHKTPGGDGLCKEVVDTCRETEEQVWSEPMPIYCGCKCVFAATGAHRFTDAEGRFKDWLNREDYGNPQQLRRAFQAGVEFAATGAPARDLTKLYNEFASRARLIAYDKKQGINLYAVYMDSVDEIFRELAASGAGEGEPRWRLAK